MKKSCISKYRGRSVGWSCPARVVFPNSLLKPDLAGKDREQKQPCWCALLFSGSPREFDKLRL